MFLDDYITTPSPSACMLHALNRFNFQLAGRFVAARKCLIPTTHYLHYHTYTTLRHQANTPVPDLPFPLHGTKPGAPSTPSLLILCMLILS